MATYQYESFIDKHFDVALKSGPEFMCRCPHHDDRSASLQINAERGLFVCFSCGWKGGPKTLLGGAVEPEVDVTDIIKRLDAIDADLKHPRRPVRLPESLLKRYAFPTGYWASRGFSEAVIAAFDLGFDPIEGDAIIPLRNIRGHLLGTIRRRLADDDGPKYLYSKHFQKKIELFASWMVAGTPTDHVVITEGAVDAMKVWQAGYPAVAQYGSALSPEQAVLLRRLGITRVTLFYDNDRAGWHAGHTALGRYDEDCIRCRSALKGKRKKVLPGLLRDFFVTTARYKRGDASDPGALAPERIAEMVERAKTA